MANSNDIVITPKDQLLAIDWKEVWRYRDMYVLFVQRAFHTAYKQTILGPLWFLITSSAKCTFRESSCPWWLCRYSSCISAYNC